MSWQAYVDDQLVGTGVVTKAGIYDLQGEEWATSPDFLSHEEMAHVAGGFATDVDIAAHFGGSTSLMGSYTMFVSGDESEMVFMQQSNCFFFFKCSTCIIAAHSTDGITGSQCRATAGKLVDYLKKQGV